MARLLAILGIVGALFATLALLGALRDLAAFVVVPIVLTGSVVFLVQRNVPGALCGLGCLALTLLAVFGAAGDVSTKSSADVSLTEGTGFLLGAAAYLALPAGAGVIHWRRFDPPWWAWVAVGLPAVALLAGLIARDDIGLQTDPLVLTAAGLALLCIAPMVMLLRSEDPDGPLPAAAA